MGVMAPNGTSINMNKMMIDKLSENADSIIKKAMETNYEYATNR